MKRDDLSLLRTIQKKTELMIEELDYIGSKADENIMLYTEKQKLKISALHDKALYLILKNKERPYHMNGFDELKLKRKLRGSTIFNTSNKKLAEILIHDNLTDLADMWSEMKQYENASNLAMEAAKELVDFEEKLIHVMKKEL